MSIAVPMIVVLHTVPLDPTPHQRSVLVTIARMADRVVVMTRTAHDRLVALYPINDATVVTIPHGAAIPTAKLLASGAGIVVPHADPQALARAIRSVVTDADRLAGMVAEARRIAPTLSWASVAAKYALLSDELIQSSQPVAI